MSRQPAPVGSETRCHAAAPGDHKSPSSSKSSARTDIPCDVRSPSRHSSGIGGIDGYVTLIADESSRFRVVDHNAKELQVTVDIFRRSGEEAGCRLRIYQFRIKVLNLARKNFRRFHG